MPVASEFHMTRCQASFFTPNLQLNRARVLSHLLSEYGEQFDGDPISFPGNPPPDIPSIILRSADDSLQLQVSQSRLDVVTDKRPMANAEAFLSWVTALGLSYLEKCQTKASRVACVLHHAIEVDKPAKELAVHFCQERWLNTGINRPEEFQLHTMKRFQLDDLFMVNSWIRCKSSLPVEIAPKDGAKPSIVVEQDMNTLADPSETRDLCGDQIEKFFRIVPFEVGKVLELYFPTNG